MKQLPLIVPIVTSIAAFVLVLLALLAGTRPGFMESYDIVTFNTSALGKNLVRAAANQDGPTPTSGFCDDLGLLAEACSTATAAAGSVQSEIVSALDDIGNVVADELAERLGIEELYSLHSLTICEGTFTPNASFPDAKRNVTKCTKGLSEGYNISSILDRQLQVGPLRLTVDDLGVTEDVQNALDILNKVLKALAIILIVAVAFTGLAMLASIASLFLVPRGGRGILLANIIISAIAFILLLVCGLLVTIGGRIVASKTNDMGDDIGLSARTGTNYIIIMWVAVGLMFITFAFWIWQLVRHRNGKTGSGSAYRQKNIRESEETGRYADDRPAMGSLRDRVRFSRSRRY